MKQQVFTVSGSGLTCDNPACDFENPEVSLDGIEEWVDHPCPKCGQNLLTREDYKRFQAFVKLTDLLNKVTEALELASEEGEDVEKRTYQVDTHEQIRITPLKED